MSVGTIGLILNVIGSLCFIVDTHRLSGILADMVGHIAEGHGRFDSKSFSKEEMNKLGRMVLSSKKLSIVGYLLFLAGFILQLLETLPE